MDIREKNILVYRVAYHYLLEIKPSLISEEELHRYFVGGHRDFSTMNDIFEQFICSFSRSSLVSGSMVCLMIFRQSSDVNFRQFVWQDFMNR